MSAGCPIVASNVTSIPEIGGDVVEYFDPTRPTDIANVIEIIWRNQKLREELINKGFERVKRFTRSDFIQSHHKAFEEARNSFSFKDYLWNRFLAEPLYRTRIHYKYRDQIVKVLKKKFRQSLSNK
jgi:hypothetical protein